MLGTLCLNDVEPRALDADELQLLRDLARIDEQEFAAVHLATMDELTLLSDRRGLLALAQHGLNLCKRVGSPASLLILDMVRFKEINDCFGHAEGDRALTGFAEAMKQKFRDSDVIGRLGGNEFEVLLTNTSPPASAEALSRLQEAVSGLNRGRRRGYDILFGVWARSPAIRTAMRRLTICCAKATC